MNAESDAPAATYALVGISGRHSGARFPIVPGVPLVLGRGSRADIVVPDDIVSRKHAVISLSPEGPVVEDLGSTNGTLVNGERVTRTVLREGDRVLVGSCVFRLGRADRVSVPEMEAVRVADGEDASKTTSSNVLSGSLDYLGPGDVLRLMIAGKRSGKLRFGSEGEEAFVQLRVGRPVFAWIAESTQFPPLKVLYRIGAYQRGTYELVDRENRTFPNEIDVQLDVLLMEIDRHAELWESLQGRLPDAGRRLVVPARLGRPLHALTGDELDVFQLAMELGTVRAILDATPLTDTDAGLCLSSLLDRGYLATL